MNVLDLSRIRGVLRTHWRWPVGLALGLALLVALGYTLATPSYRASASVILDSRGVERLFDTVRDTSPTPATVVTTNLDVIRSETVLRRLVSLLALDLSADEAAKATLTPEQRQARPIAEERRAAWQKATQGTIDFDDFLVQRWLPKAVTVAPAALNSNVVTIQVDYANPDGAAMLATGLGKAYLEVALALSLAPTQQTERYFAQKIIEARAELARAETARSQFQRDNGLVSVNEGADLESALMSEMASAATQIRARSADINARSGTASGNPNGSPEAVQAQVVQQLSTDLARQRATLAEMGSRLGSNHPQVQAAQQQIDELSRRLGDEAQRVASSVELSARSANTSDRAVQQLLGQQRARVMALKQARDQLNLLQQDVDRARRNHDLALQSHHAAASRNDAQVSDARMLAAASAPLDPTRPPLLLALIFAMASGGLLGAGAAFIAEQRRPLMRIDQDLTELLGLDILAEVPRLALAGNSRWDDWTRWSRGLRRNGVPLP